MGDNPNLARARKLLHTATQLIALARDLERESRPESSNPIAKFEPNDAVLVELARQIYHARRQRSLLKGWDDLFGEPAWDMLIDLFVAAHEGRNVSVTSACIAAAVPVTTALRWVRILEHRNLIVREDDPTDHRRSMVRMSAFGFGELNRYFRFIADGHSAFVMLAPAKQREAVGPPTTT